jgi:hypothetical protein
MKAVLALFLMVPTAALGTTWTVHKDPGIPADQIGQVVLAAAAGDTVLVGPGTYSEHIPMGSRALILLSTDGAEATILDGQGPIPDREGSILYGPLVEHADLTVAGFTLRGGTGARLGGYVSGGAIALFSSDFAGKVRIAGCIIEDNRVVGNSDPTDDQGGGIWLGGVSDAVLERCRFSRNAAGYGSGAHIYFKYGNLRVTETQFDMDDLVLIGIDCLYNDDGSIRFERCRFHGVSGSGDNVSIRAAGAISLVDNDFIDETSHLARVLRFNFNQAEALMDVTMEQNRFFGPATAINEADIIIQANRVRFTGTENTFVNTRVSVASVGGGRTQCHRNIFCRSHALLANELGGDVTCNDAWPDSITVRNDNMHLESNFSADPMFCNDGAGDFHVAQESPCAPGNSPDDCGLIGALPVACSNTSTRRTSWGQIRASFR